MSNTEQTLSIIKPDAVERNLESEIKEMFKNKGFSIVKEKKIQIDKSEAERFYKDSCDVLFYPAQAGGSQDLRNTFYMSRRRRPMVPAPTSCPMPDKQRSSERRDRLYLLYLQPSQVLPATAGGSRPPSGPSSLHAATLG